MSAAASQAESFGGALAALCLDAEHLAVHGRALKALGPLAPQCLVRPYRKYRQAIADMVATIYQDIGEQRGEEVLAQFRSRAMRLEYLLASMPDVTQEWSDGPDQWDADHAGWAPGEFVTPILDGGPIPIPPGPLGKLAAEIPLIDFAPGYDAAVNAAASDVTRQTFWRGFLSAGGRAAGATVNFLKTKNFWLLVAFTVLPPVVEAGWQWVFADSPKTSVMQQFRNLQLSFEQDYIPRTAQQWQSVIKAVRASGGNPVLLERLLRASNPWEEKSVPPTSDSFNWVNLGHLAGIPMPPKGPPVAAILSLAGGMVASWAIADDGGYE